VTFRTTRRGFLASAVAGAGTLALRGFARAGPAAPAGPFTFVQLCDPQLGFGGYEHDVKTFRQAVRQINALEPDFVLICGDLVDVPDDRSIDDINAIVAELVVPCYAAAGNHDIGKNPTRASLDLYRRKLGPDRIAFEHKGCRFVIANSMLWKARVAGESEAHDAWFKDALRSASEKRQPIFVVAHHPPYVATPDEKEDYHNWPPEKRRELLALFVDRGVVAVLSGHLHKQVVGEYQGIQRVSGGSTSKNFDKRPLGFRLWHVAEPRPYRHDAVLLNEL
jgi:3',5'-cyclic AMP phosphodiesterase CpdA